MTQAEIDIAIALQLVTYLPGSFDKRFARNLKNWKNRDMTEKGRAYMMKLLDKYRRQIPNYNSLKSNPQLYVTSQ